MVDMRWQMVFLALLLCFVCGPVLSADAPKPYDKLDLTPEQSRQIVSLDQEWKSKYMELQPQILSEKRHLIALLNNPHADPLEISGSQQKINRLKEQLSGLATVNYLRKRRLLSGKQKELLEFWLKRMVAERQKVRM